jgi:hypothetical protein|tara:strand:- start:64 stop:186 length:123 start_codon:yes stop_codon:yes gene_type:complete
MKQASNKGFTLIELLPGWGGSSPVAIPASEAKFYGRAVNE